MKYGRAKAWNKIGQTYTNFQNKTPLEYKQQQSKTFKLIAKILNSSKISTISLKLPRLCAWLKSPKNFAIDQIFMIIYLEHFFYGKNFKRLDNHEDLSQKQVHA